MNGGPLKVEFSEPAEAELVRAYDWLKTFGLEVAEKWLTGLMKALGDEAGLLASVDLRRTLAVESRPGREQFILLYRPSGRRSSPWHILYETADANGDGLKDTLYVTSVRHATRTEEP